MEEMIEARVAPEEVWKFWKKTIDSKAKEKSNFKYKVLDIKEGESFSILWKTLFVRLIFSHSVKPTKKGSEICYKVQIKGLFAWPVQWLIGPKIQKNISYVLKSVVRDLEDQRVK